MVVWAFDPTSDWCRANGITVYLSAWVWSEKCAFHLHYHGSYQFQECVNEMISITFLAPTLIYLYTVLTKWQAWDWECSWSLHNHCAVARHVDQYLRHILIHVVNMSIWFNYIIASAAFTYKHEPRVTTKRQELTSQKQIRYEYNNGSWIDGLCFPGMSSKFQDRPT